MERRSFLKGLGAVIGGLALAEAVPLGRVYSFPSEIVPPTARVLKHRVDNRRSSESDAEHHGISEKLQY
jgi:hypothetical protein